MCVKIAHSSGLSGVKLQRLAQRGIRQRVDLVGPGFQSAASHVRQGEELVGIVRMLVETGSIDDQLHEGFTWTFRVSLEV